MSDTGHIAVHEFEGSLVAVIQIELSDEVIYRFREDLLAEIRRRGAPSVIVDLSGLDVMDLHEFDELRRVFRMASIMGCRPILAGLQPGIVAALVQMDADTDGLETALSVEQALELLRPAADDGPGDGAPSDDDDARDAEETSDHA
jgi:rsbT antagonist protein RsbS